MRGWILGAVLSTAVLAAGCSDDNDDNPPVTGDSGSGGTTRDSALARGKLEYGAADAVASCGKNENAEGGRFYRVQIPSRVDGEAIVFTLFEPDQIDCANKHPLILQGHGYSGSRLTEKEGSGGVVGAISQILGSLPVSEYTANGYAVISIDQRGHGESGGTVRVMDPEFEGQDLIAIVDWAEQHLDYLAYRDRNLLLGSIGGSYGGGYQLLLYAVDPDRRLDAIVPQITWHDLTYSLAPGDVVKSYWALFLAAAGDANTSFGQDPFIRATLLEGAVSNHFPGAALPFFNYHSLSYFCDNPRALALHDDADTSEYLLDPVTSLLPLTADGKYVVKTPPLASMPKVDALLVQGVRDDLFNLNEAYHNFECLKRGGGDVRLMTYESGHHFLSPNLGLIAEGLNAQGLPLDSHCGAIDAGEATLAWFNEKLKGVGNANEVIKTGKNVCYALTIGDAVEAPQVTVGGTEFPIELPGGLPVPVVIGNPVPVIVPLTATGEESEVVAGIPTAKIKVSRGDAALDELCQESTDPLLGLATCDSTVFVGVGVIKLGSLIPLVPELLEEQVRPLRGIGAFEVELAGVAERIAPGDQIVLLVYGWQDGFALSTSRDLLTPVVTVSGTVNVPLLGNLPNIAAE